MRGRGHSFRRSGYLLMEVVISIGLLVLGLTFIGGQVRQARDATYDTADLTRVLMLVESKLAELETGLVSFDEEVDDEVEGDFTLRFPSYGWRMRFEQTATEGMWAVTLEILYGPRESLDDDFEPDDAVVVYTVHTLRAEPAVLDLETDLGLDEETILQLSETLPPEYFDPPFFDPQALPQLEMEELIELLPALMSLFGDNAGPLLASLPPEFRSMLDAAGGGESGGDGRSGPIKGGSGRNGAAAGADPFSQLSDEDLEAFGMTRDDVRGGGASQTDDDQ